VTSGRSDLHIDASRPNNIASIAVVMPPSDMPQTGTEPTPAERPTDGEKQIHLAVWTTDIATATGTATDPKFLFGPLGDVVDALLVRLDVQRMLPNAFTAGWIANLLLDGEIGHALVRTGDDAGRAAERLGRWLPASSINRDDDRWMHIENSAELAPCLASLPTAYSFLHRAYDGFREKLGQVGWGEDLASRSFMYSMVGATRNSFLLEQLAEKYRWGPTPAIADLGGGFGFLGLELAAKGWHVAVADYDPAKTEVLGPWLSERSPRPLLIEFYTRTIDDIPREGIPGTQAPDVISFFHSLLMAERSHVAAIVRTCWERLAPGGALVIHELVQGTPGEQPPHLFHQDELLRLIAENAAPPTYLSVEDGTETKIFVPGTSLIIARRTS
jgi:2-polyprenyl-3-methyl-5-hydroxy-6-metoxy-1,4-benzoquinol methylase